MLSGSVVVNEAILTGES
jgi:manganese-transporting P-type ATPase